MPRKIAPCEAKTQAVLALLQAQSEAHSGEEFRSAGAMSPTQDVPGKKPPSTARE